MRRTLLFTTVALVAIGAINYTMLAERRTTAPAAPVTVQGPSDIAAAAPGVVEGVSEEIRVSSQIGGRLQRVLVDEGDAVKAGQVLAVVENDDFRARVASAEATLRLREADARRIHNGARDQERHDAAA